MWDRQDGRMKTQNYQFDGVNGLLAALVVLFVIMFVPTIIFAIKGDALGVAISLTVISMLFLGCLVMGAFALGARHNKKAMQDGAEIALAAQEFNDKWDASKFKTAGSLLTEGARLGKSIREPDHIALPMPSQGAFDWLPDVAMLEHGDDGDLGDVIDSTVRHNE